MRTRPFAAPLAAGVMLAALSGCGTELQPEMHPGRAAVVEGRNVSMDDVDALAERLCDWQRPSLEANGTRWPMSYVRSVAVDTLVADELVRQFAEDRGYDVDAALKVARERAQQGAVNPNDPEAEADENAVEYLTYVEFQGAILSQAGAEELGADASDEAARQRGAEMFAEYREGADVDVDPRFGSLDPETFAYSAPTGSLSVRVSDGLADAENATSFDQEYVGSLPPAQRCG